MRRTCLFGLGLPKFSILLDSLLELLIIITVLYAKIGILALWTTLMSTTRDN